MSDITEDLHKLRRPRLLMQAVRHGLATARKTGPWPSPADLQALILAEARMEATRAQGDASYCSAKHVELWVRLLRALPDIAADPG